MNTKCCARLGLVGAILDCFWIVLSLLKLKYEYIISNAKEKEINDSLFCGYLE